MRHQPHNVAPQRSSARVLITYKNFAASKNISHIGLGVAALNTCRSLRASGIWADVVPARDVADIRGHLHDHLAQARASGDHQVSHVVISAPWLSVPDLQKLLIEWPNVHFAVVSHSNIGFLAADPNGIQLLRACGDLSLSHHNFTVAGNSEKFCEAWSAMYGRPTQWLPNLYDASTFNRVGQRLPWQPGSTLRLGCFGATRQLKNLVSAVAAGVELSSLLRADVEVWVNSGRAEGAGQVPTSVQQLVAGLRHCKLVDAGWSAWPQFRATVSRMNLLVSPSYTESFNMVTADGCAEGVASVVSDAIDWAPEDWCAPSDDVGAIARTARRLLGDTHAVTEGQDALQTYVSRGLRSWENYLL